jgi:hypothetical protein
MSTITALTAMILFRIQPSGRYVTQHAPACCFPTAREIRDADGSKLPQEAIIAASTAATHD